MDASALDEILNWMDADGYGVPIGTHERKDAAREELAALRARVSELGMLLGFTRKGYRWHLRHQGAHWYVSEVFHTRRMDSTFRSFTLESDGTGLPLLSEEARRALALA